MTRILVIDDDAALRFAVRRALEPLGHQMLEAEDGSRGLELLAESEVELVITDIFMPKGDGIELLRRMRNEFPDIKVIAISGGGFGGRVDLLQDAELLGAARTLHKPFGAEQIRQAVRDVLGAG